MMEALKELAAGYIAILAFIVAVMNVMVIVLWARTNCHPKKSMLYIFLLPVFLLIGIKLWPF